MCVCVCVCVCVYAKSLQLCLTLCDPMDCSPPGSSVPGILQARILERVAISPPRDLPNPGIKPTSLMSPELAGGFFTTGATWEAPNQLYSNKKFKNKKIYIKPKNKVYFKNFFNKILKPTKIVN